MKKYCRNCGAELNENAQFCGKCGTIVDGGPEQRQQKGSAGGSNKWKYILIITLAVIVLIAAIVVRLVISFTGYNGLLRKTMNAVKNYDIDTLVEESSEAYFSMDDDDFLETRYENQVGGYIDKFEDSVGHNYKFRYETNEIYVVSDRAFDNTIKSIEERYPDLDTDFIEKVAVADVTMSATQGKRTKKIDVKVYMSREDGRKWKLLWFTD